MLLTDGRTKRTFKALGQEVFGPLGLLFVADVFEDAEVGDGLNVCCHCLHQCADLFSCWGFECVGRKEKGLVGEEKRCSC